MIYKVEVQYQDRMEYYTVQSDIGIDDATVFVQKVFCEIYGGRLHKIYREIYSS